MTGYERTPEKCHHCALEELAAVRARLAVVEAERDAAINNCESARRLRNEWEAAGIQQLTRAKVAEAERDRLKTALSGAITDRDEFEAKLVALETERDREAEEKADLRNAHAKLARAIKAALGLKNWPHMDGAVFPDGVAALVATVVAERDAALARAEKAERVKALREDDLGRVTARALATESSLAEVRAALASELRQHIDCTKARYELADQLDAARTILKRLHDNHGEMGMESETLLRLLVVKSDWDAVTALLTKEKR